MEASLFLTFVPGEWPDHPLFTMYSVKEAGPGKVVLVPASFNYTITSLLLLAIGGTALYFGVTNLGNTGTELSWPVALVVFGTLFAGAGIGFYIKKGSFINVPQSITFDNAKGVVVIEMDPSSTQKGYIRYDEIDRFDVERETRGGKTPSHYYHVYLLKKDGGRWYLTVSRSRTAADNVLQHLNTHVAVRNPVTLEIKPVISDKLEKVEKQDKTTIFWQNAVDISSFFGPAIVVFFLGGVGIVTFLAGNTTIGMALGGLAVVAIVGFAQKIRKDATTRYSVSLDKEQVEYSESDKSSGAVRKSKSIPLQEVHSIVYTFSPSGSVGDDIVIRTIQQHEDWMKGQTGLMEAIKAHFKSYNELIRFNIKALNAVECLQLEHWLQEVMKKRGNVHVQ